MISDQMVAAYRDTLYTVDGAPELDFRIGVENHALAACLAGYGAATAAYLTAWNPFSVMTAPAVNAAADAEFRAQLDDGGWRYLTGAGIGRDAGWPPEQSLLVFGLPRAEAERYARALRQNAFVWIEVGHPPALVLTAD